MSSPPTRVGRLKVLRVIARLNVGGPARHVVLLDRGLRARGYDTLLVHGTVGVGEASLETLADESGVPHLRVRELERRVSALSDVAAFVQLVSIIFKVRPDVVHTHTAKAGALGRVAAGLFNLTRRKPFRCVVVHTFHGNVLSGYFGRIATFLIVFAERMLALCTDRIVAISRLQRDEIVSRFRVASSYRTAVIPLGLDLAPFTEVGPSSRLRRSLDIPEGDVVVGYVGRFVPVKDLPTLVEAFALAQRNHGNLRLVLAGDGPARSDIERLAVERHVRDRTHFLGWRPNLPELYAAFDICALSSVNEGTPVALIEAMAAAKAVVATNVGGVPDVIEHGRTGLLVPPRDPHAFGAAIMRLVSHPEERFCFGQSAQSSVVNRFAIDRLVKDIDTLYTDLIAARDEHSIVRRRSSCAT